MGKITAAVLSLLIVGLGQFYAGHFWRAVAWFFGGILIISISTFTMGIGCFLIVPLIWIGSAWDAYNVYQE
jgi:hypothetical protein